MRIAGPIFVIGFYYLMLYHTWAFLTIIATVLRKRVGTEFAVLWTMIGIAITYNVVWNHALAMILKPGSPTDLIVSILKVIKSTFCMSCHLSCCVENRKIARAVEKSAQQS